MGFLGLLETFGFYESRPSPRQRHCCWLKYYILHNKIYIEIIGITFEKRCKLAYFCSKRHRNKKSQFFEIDAIIAIGILIAGLIYLKQLTSEQPIKEDINKYSEESAKLLKTMKVNDLNVDNITAIKANCKEEFVDINSSLSKQIALCYFLEQGADKPTAKAIVISSLDKFIPNEYGYKVVLRSPDENATIYQSQKPETDDLAVARTMVTDLLQVDPNTKIEWTPALIEIQVWK
jgi:hypothetical protein